MSTWYLHKVQIRNLLGFRDLREWAFDSGLHVMEAPNHTGKTSFTLALLWAITGEVPGLPRINKTSFRLFNKHAGKDAEQLCRIELKSRDDRSFIITRYNSPGADKVLTVELDGVAIDERQAQEIILDELKLKPASIQGCGVVLQDYRLGFITGKEADISDVINDMLGLKLLSELSPLLKEREKEAKALCKEINAYLTAADPLARWTERDGELHRNLEKREGAAADAGFEPARLENPAETAENELRAAAGILQVPVPEEAQSASALAGHLRGKLAELRQASPYHQPLAEAEARLGQIKRWETEAGKCRDRYSEISRETAAAEGQGVVDTAALADAVEGLERELQQNRKRRRDMESEQGLLTSAYSYMMDHAEARECPVCGSDTPAQAVVARLKDQLDEKLIADLAAVAEEEKKLGERKKLAGERLSSVRELKGRHEAVCGQIEDLRNGMVSEPFGWSEAAEPDAVFPSATARDVLRDRLQNAIAGLATAREAAEKEFNRIRNLHLQQEQQIFQPAEKQINRVNDIIIPLIEAVAAIEGHGALRDNANSRKTELEGLRDRAQTLAENLQQFSKALARHEQSTADAAVNSRLPLISAFFRDVAGNPDYDGLKISAAVIRDKVTYKISATSSSVGNLEDAVGHVLSEGDLSAAGIAMLMGLASGDANGLGFLILDDPAQGMDETLQGNLARRLAGGKQPEQIIILTHQSAFESALKAAGASGSKMHSWKSGKVEYEYA